LTFFLQIHCADAPELREKCDDWDGASLQLQTEHTEEALITGKRVLESIARRHGWKRKRRGWVCPHCLTLEGKVHAKQS